jgi:hypothetical protein
VSVVSDKLALYCGMSGSVLLRPAGNDIASIYGPYMSESQLRKVTVGMNVISTLA